MAFTIFYVLLCLLIALILTLFGTTVWWFAVTARDTITRAASKLRHRGQTESE